MLAARQYSNSSASLNPFNSIPQAQPTSTQTLFPAAISLTESSLPTTPTPTPTPNDPLASSTYNGVSPSLASVLSSLVGDLEPTRTRTNSFGISSRTATSQSARFTGISGTKSPMAAIGSTSAQSLHPTSIATSGIPISSKSFSFSLSHSDVTRTSSLTSVTSSANLITTSTHFSTVSPSVSTTSHSSTSTSSTASQTSSIASVPAARATSTSPDISTQHKSALSSGAIAGITFASAASVAILAFLLFLCMRRRRTHKPPSVYPEEAYLYDPPITPPSNMPPSVQAAQPWMRGTTAYHPTSQLPPMMPYSPPMAPNSPPMRAVTPEGYERVGLLGGPEGQQDLAMLGSWPSLRGRNSASYRPLGTGRGYRLPPVHEDLQEAVDNDPRNPFRDENVA